MPNADITTDEQMAAAFHERTLPTAVGLWRDGLNIYLSAVNSLHGRRTVRDEEQVLVGLLLSSWNSLYCAYTLALRGYHRQALNLMRTPLENWMAYWYLRNWPEEHVRFLRFEDPLETDPKRKAPSFNDMSQKIGAAQGSRDTTLRALIKRLHLFAHASGASVAMTMSIDQCGTVHYSLGPARDREAFRYCAAEAAPLITLLLEAVENLRLLSGIGSLPEWTEYKGRVESWLDAEARGS